MKPDVSRSCRQRRKPNDLCCVCEAEARLKGQRHGRKCHALTQAFWRVKNKVKGRTFDDDVKMVALGLELLQRRLGIGVRQIRRAA